jgi:hypothetical protein
MLALSPCFQSDRFSINYFGSSVMLDTDHGFHRFLDVSKDFQVTV